MTQTKNQQQAVNNRQDAVATDYHSTANMLKDIKAREDAALAAHRQKQADRLAAAVQQRQEREAIILEGITNRDDEAIEQMVDSLKAMGVADLNGAHLRFAALMEINKALYIAMMREAVKFGTDVRSHFDEVAETYTDYTDALCRLAQDIYADEVIGIEGLTAYTRIAQ